MDCPWCADFNSSGETECRSCGLGLAGGTDQSILRLKEWAYSLLASGVDERDMVATLVDHGYSRRRARRLVGEVGARVVLAADRSEFAGSYPLGFVIGFVFTCIGWLAVHVLRGKPRTRQGALHGWLVGMGLTLFFVACGGVR